MNGWNSDPYDTVIPKYSTATDIYDALQALREEQERSYQREVAKLQENYEAALGKLFALAERRGLAAEFAKDMKMLVGGVV